MIALASEDPSPKRRKPAWHKKFMAMLPTIRRYARVAFRHLRGDERDDAIQEVVSNCLVAYVRPFKKKKTDVAHPTVLVKYAIAQYADGRRVGNRLNIREVLSKYAQRAKRFIVNRLDQFDKDENAWIEAVVEDTHTPVAEQAAFRIDFPEWLDQLSRRNRRIAEALAQGNTTSSVAKRFRVSPGRISQKRREFCQSWKNFHGEGPNGNAA